MNGTTSLFDAAASPPLVGPAGSGAISGGLLRPGSIDQSQFLQMLQAQQSAREAAGVGGRPVQMPIQSFQDGIPTLTPAQFAALVGQPADGPDSTTTPEASATPMPSTATTARAAYAASAQMAAPIKLSGISKVPAQGQSSQTQTAAAAEASDDQPAIFRASAPKLMDSVQSPAMPSPAAQSPATQTAAAPQPPAADPDAKADTTAKTAATTKAAPSDPNVIHLLQPPDKDEQKDMRVHGKRWVVDETPGARQLFFGPDGEFGWDDFLDLINPLQHIPIIAQIYRAVTGDQMYGAAELLGALPFGPIGAIGLGGAIVDLAVKDTTGKDIGENVEAALFGTGSGNGNAGAAPAAADSTKQPGTTGERADLETGDTVTATQTASREVGGSTAAASLRHEDCRA